MRVFVTKVFRRWYTKELIEKEDLLDSAGEVERGLIDADLGGGLFKKRVARKGQGKSGGFRTILAYQEEDRLFFLYGFAKNERANIDKKELKALKIVGGELLSYSDKKLKLLIEIDELAELEDERPVEPDEEEGGDDDEI